MTLSKLASRAVIALLCAAAPAQAITLHFDRDQITLTEDDIHNDVVSTGRIALNGGDDYVIDGTDGLYVDVFFDGFALTAEGAGLGSLHITLESTQTLRIQFQYTLELRGSGDQFPTEVSDDYEDLWSNQDFIDDDLDFGTGSGALTGFRLHIDPLVMTSYGPVSGEGYPEFTATHITVGVDYDDFTLPEVPLPAAGGLLLCALAGFGALRRRPSDAGSAPS
ncbi:MAG: VPLPA-CTERM sorting domain-containing protein [Paracoccaceae bacterium]